MHYHLASQGLSNPGIATCVPKIHSAKQRMWCAIRNNRIRCVVILLVPFGISFSDAKHGIKSAYPWRVTRDIFYWFRLASEFLTQKMAPLSISLVSTLWNFLIYLRLIIIVMLFNICLKIGGRKCSKEMMIYVFLVKGFEQNV